MNDFSLSKICDYVTELTGASAASPSETIQELWSGYGQILRLQLQGAKRASVVVKLIALQPVASHPRGWSGHRSHERKLRSYQVEESWYRLYSSQCHKDCRVPQCLGIRNFPGVTAIVLEDLREVGFSQVKSQVNWREIQTCIHWLAHFHAQFLHTPPQQLWPTGTYWHLATRPDEWERIEDERLRRLAPQIDQILSSCHWPTIVHGDAKLANFCFSPDGEEVAAVDFQYVGAGCGMKDLAYFIGSCLSAANCERREEEILDIYFSQLSQAIQTRSARWDASEIETCWRPLYRVAWADFHRFLKGWSPNHWKLHDYSEQVTAQVLQSIENGEFT